MPTPIMSHRPPQPYITETSAAGKRRITQAIPRVPRMLNKEDFEGFLDRLGQEGAAYKEVQPGLWVVKPGGSLDFDVVVNWTPPVAVLRVKVMELPKDKAQLA